MFYASISRILNFTRDSCDAGLNILLRFFVILFENFVMMTFPYLEVEKTTVWSLCWLCEKGIKLVAFCSEVEFSIGFWSAIYRSKAEYHRPWDSVAIQRSCLGRDVASNETFAVHNHASVNWSKLFWWWDWSDARVLPWQICVLQLRFISCF